jgi:LysM repeat protein
VPTVQPTVPGAAVQPGAVKTYVVQPGDDLVTIASRFNTSKITLIQLNNMTLSDTLQPGTTIRVP